MGFGVCNTRFDSFCEGNESIRWVLVNYRTRFDRFYGGTNLIRWVLVSVGLDSIAFMEILRRFDGF